MSLNNDIVFHKERMIDNIHFMNYYLLNQNISWTFVIKAFNSYPISFIEEISNIPCNSIASDNVNHLEVIKRLNSKMETWFLNYLGKEKSDNFIDVNLTHSDEFISDKSCLMLSIDPERDGIEYNYQFPCKRLGAYLDCAKLPKSEFFEAWSRLKIPPELTQSLGTSISFGSIDYLKSKGVNHFRLGEIILTGKNLSDGSKIQGLRQDVFDSHKKVSYHLISHSNIFYANN